MSKKVALLTTAAMDRKYKICEERIRQATIQRADAVVSELRMLGDPMYWELCDDAWSVAYLSIAEETASAVERAAAKSAGFHSWYEMQKARAREDED
jgi:hypothetical protein